ncbi:Phytol kinase 1, chloroplastic [Seminavis robusta]|uniref:Phytol kinase 1, chloroplastic n=1 Tax=Seminavis robusta TaxID=568900 RepID=A0A9N8EUH7_9STRA|nr:Phytol kinase 1, chloroplastic [Seminavis robusta]|eukprot:Sro1917_g305280.1 Phytol kinase 1, chloroplastic (346) ;mRNA; r:2393-3603
MRERALVLSLTCIFLTILGSAAETRAFSISPISGHHNQPSIGHHQPEAVNLHVLEASKQQAATRNVDEEEEEKTPLEVRLEDERVAKLRKAKQAIPAIAAVTLASVSLAAKLGILHGPLLAGGGFGPYTDAMIARDAGSAVLCGILGYLFVKVNEWFAEKGYLDPRDSRKIIHTFSAPLFMVLWPLFSPAVGARFFAASISFINVLKLYIAGSGGDDSLAFAVSSIALFWKDGPVGIVALSAMAAGDGLADLLGRRYGRKNKWFFNKDKSIAGSTAFWIGGTACALTLLKIMSIPLNPVIPLEPELVVAGIVLITALLEVVPVEGLDDNWIVPLSAAVLTALAFS